MAPAFLDTNIPIYAAGREHALKQACREILLLAAQHPQAFLTDAEVLQELLHRYLSLHRWDQGRQVVSDFAQLMRDRVEAVTATDVEQAALLADEGPGLSARDLLHAAVMARAGVSQIITADRGFDRLSMIERLDPEELGSWRDSLVP
jgi:predicted nucleic acid-binding protein